MKSDADPNLIVYFGGEYVPMREARIGILTHALHYGTGVFEGIRAYWSETAEELLCAAAQRALPALETKLRNPAHRCAALGCGIVFDHRRTGAAQSFSRRSLHSAAGLQKRGAHWRGHDDQDSFFIAAVPYGEYLNSENGLHAGVSSWRRIEDNAIPPRAKICGAYANSALAGDEARRSGFDEAILLNESGHVTEGATCNLFMMRKGRLITPAVTDNILEGITRDSIKELAARELGLETVERPIARSELYVCDELFLTGTAVGVAPVVRIDHRPIANGAIGEVTHRLRRLYFDATHGRLADYRKWLLPVYAAGRPEEQNAARPVETSLA